MVGFFGLLFVACVTTFIMVWLITYIPIHSKFLGISYSPRLFACKFLVPFDIVMSSIMVLGPWIIGAGGLGHTILATFTGLGLTAGTVLIRKVLVPKWRAKYQEEAGIKSTPKFKMAAAA